MNGPLSSGCVGVACLLLSAVSQPAVQSPNWAKELAYSRSPLGAWKHIDFNAMKLHFLQQEGRMGNWSEIKLEWKKTKLKKAYEIQLGIHSSQGISLRVSLQLQSAISTSVSSLPNLAVFGPLADPY